MTPIDPENPTALDMAVISALVEIRDLTFGRIRGADIFVALATPEHVDAIRFIGLMHQLSICGPKSLRQNDLQELHEEVVRISLRLSAVLDGLEHAVWDYHKLSDDADWSEIEDLREEITPPLARLKEISSEVCKTANEKLGRDKGGMRPAIDKVGPPPIERFLDPLLGHWKSAGLGSSRDDKEAFFHLLTSLHANIAMTTATSVDRAELSDRSRRELRSYLNKKWSVPR